MVAENEEIATGVLGGIFFPTLFQRYDPGESETAVLESMPGPLKRKPVQAGAFAGLTGTILGVMGAKGRGLFAGNSSAVAMSTAFGAASLGTSLTYAMYPVEKRAAAAGLMGVPAEGEVEIEKGSPSSMEIEVGETSSPSTETESEEEKTEATPSGKVEAVA